MNKGLKLGLLFALSAGLTATGCDGGKEDKVLSLDNIKIGMICLHDESSTYDKNFIDSMYAAMEELGLKKNQLSLSTGIPEEDACYQEATTLASTCDIVFADSFGHEDYMIAAAKENPKVTFAHATGVKAHTEQLPNFTNAFASIYEGRYLAGLVAGQKMTEQIQAGEYTMSEAKIGYVGAWSFAEVISGFTSFYLGALQTCPSATMEVKFTGSWYDYDLEHAAAVELIGRGCKLISGHADSYGAPKACEDCFDKGQHVYNVAYNGSTSEKCPQSYLVSSRINWTPFFKELITKTIAGESLGYDWCGNISTGSVELTGYGSGVSDAAKLAVNNAKQGFIDNNLHVFDTKYLKNLGVAITAYIADVDYDDAYTGDHDAIWDGYFHESELRSGPYFNLQIDGITWLNTAY